MATLKQIYLDTMSRRVVGELTIAQDKALRHDPSYVISLAAAKEQFHRYQSAINQAYEDLCLRAIADPIADPEVLSSADVIAKAGYPESWDTLSEIEKSMEIAKVRRILTNAYAAGYSLNSPEK